MKDSAARSAAAGGGWRLAMSDRSAILTSVQRLAALLLCLSPAALAEPRRALVVALDPGHGGAYPHDGAHGRGGLVEKDVAPAVTLRTKEAMEQAGVTVVLTRE